MHFALSPSEECWIKRGKVKPGENFREAAVSAPWLWIALPSEFLFFGVGIFMLILILKCSCSLYVLFCYICIFGAFSLFFAGLRPLKGGI